MRLLNAVSLKFEEFFDDSVPNYAILSHRWVSQAQEVSYTEYLAESKRDTGGFAKILALCDLTQAYQLRYCWIDTCCIDKSSSAELSEAINSMYSWYKRAEICFVYLNDVNSKSKTLRESEWFYRGWTLQELLAPIECQFFDSQWQLIGTRWDLRGQISQAARIDEDLLAGEKTLADYSVAQIMSWASKRKTSRLEDQAYCLLGLFGVNIPLLYGEGNRAFLRLQEAILALGADNSLFAWGSEGIANRVEWDKLNILATSPSAFEGCGNVLKGFATQRILFEVTSRGMMVSIHRSYDRKTLDELLGFSKKRGHPDSRSVNKHIGLTLPLGCFRRVPHPDNLECQIVESYFLQLIADRGKWRRVGIARQYDPLSMARYGGSHFLAYVNDYVRLWIHYNTERRAEESNRGRRLQLTIPEETYWLHIRDNFDRDID